MKVSILIYIQKVLKMVDCIVHQKFMNLFHQVLFLLCNLLFLLSIRIITIRSISWFFTFTTYSLKLCKKRQLNTYDKFLISFDVTSLFTNIALEETINIATDTIFENQWNIKFTRKELQKLVKIATPETHLILIMKFTIKKMAY